jgi:hypothetical protein
MAPNTTATPSKIFSSTSTSHKMATLTYNTTTKQFTLSYSYTNAKGKLKSVAPKPRGLTALTNQILKAQERGVTEFTGSISRSRPLNSRCRRHRVRFSKQLYSQHDRL